jgi:hypothetical protein
MTPENATLLETYRLEGLIDEDFKPIGDTNAQIRSSIECRAYVAWIKKNGALCGNHGPETCRSAFQMRHDPQWTMPPIELAPIPETRPAPTGWARPDPVLPRGDAWEGNELEPAEDLPPPPEV